LELLNDIRELKMGDGLPSIQESVQQHMELFKAIRRCENLQINSDVEVPIT
jgi:hypothetical protein